MAEFLMPSLGADMDSGVLLEWLVRPGDQVAKGDVVAVVDTSKAAIEVECFTSGVVRRLLVEPGTRVAVGAPLAVIAPVPQEVGMPAAAPGPARPPRPPPVAAPARPGEVAAVPGQPAVSPLVRRLAAQHNLDLAGVVGTGRGGRITRADVEAAVRFRAQRPRVSPLARRTATELGVDLTQITGTGVGGAIRAEDVRTAAPASTPRASRPVPKPGGPRDTRTPTAMREQTARLMARSKKEIPHYYLSTTVDMSVAVRWLTERNRRHAMSERILPAALLLKAAAVAASKEPQLNGHWTGEQFTPASQVRLGVAVSLRGGGLVVPCVDNAAMIPLPDLMARIRDLATRARAGRLRASDLADPTITVSNLGDSGVETVLGVIYPPQVALVGFGAVLDRPWAVDGLLGVRPVVVAGLSADHRVSDGVTGARFLQTLTRLLQKPEEL